jgi:hypothetical protein
MNSFRPTLFMKNRDFRIRYKNKPELIFNKECKLINDEFAINHLRHANAGKQFF